MTLRDLHTIQPVYVLPRDSLVTGVLIPSFRNASALRSMVGFFNSASFREIAPGLAEFLARSASPMRLIISPYISAEDQQAMKEGLTTPPELLAQRLVDLIGEAEVTERALVRHAFECLAFLIGQDRLQIKVSLIRAGLFHPKVWLFEDGEDVLVVHGSSNMTNAGLTTNLEHVTVSRSWADPTQAEVVKVLSEEFDALWEGSRDYAVTIDLPNAIKERILQVYEGDNPPTPPDFFAAWQRDSERGFAAPLEEDAYSALVRLEPRVFRIPADLEYETGDFGYQGAAVSAWEEQGRKGVLEMATGSGKTVVALICAHRLFTEGTPLLMVIAAPFLPLIAQWREEARCFGLEPICPGAESTRARKEAATESIIRRLRLGFSSIETLVVTHDLLCDPWFQEILSRYQGPSLLIGDEVHNLGRAGFLANKPEFFLYRLGLSATPERQFDPEGSRELTEFFGEVAFGFTLAEAIGRSLVPYDYFVHPVELTADELDEWSQVTDQLRRAGWSFQGVDEEGTGFISDRVRALLIRRRRILEEATAKIDALRAHLETMDRRSIYHTLIYATDKGPDQLAEVNALLGELGILYHQLTAEETSRPELAVKLMRSFAAGELQVLTAKRVLDEGVDIPEVATAYILASTTVERQWIQRRGRVLRKCPAIKKDFATIHDFIVLPPSEVVSAEIDTRRIVKQELERVSEFAQLARNAAAPGGPLQVVQPIHRKYFG